MASIESSALRAMLAGQRLRRSHALPIALQRRELELAAALAPMPPGGRAVAAPGCPVPSEWVGSPASPGGRAILYLHGGGYALGSCRTHRALAARVALAADTCALLVGYRLAPEHPFPAALDDALAAYRWLLGAGYPPHQIGLAGDSAGGGLALALALRLRDLGLPGPAAAALCSPWVDLAADPAELAGRAARDPWMVPEMLGLGRLYCGAHTPRDPLISPIYGDLRGLPPLLVQAGEDELLLGDAERLAERARAAGVAARLEVWPAMWHVWHFYAPLLPEAGAAIAAVGAFLRAQLSPAAHGLSPEG